MSSRYYQKPQMQPARQSNGKVYYQRCNHIISRGEQQGQPCNAETQNGSYICRDCRALEAKTEGFKLRDLGVLLKSHI